MVRSLTAAALGGGFVQCQQQGSQKHLEARCSVISLFHHWVSQNHLSELVIKDVFMGVEDKTLLTSIRVHTGHEFGDRSGEVKDEKRQFQLFLIFCSEMEVNSRLFFRLGQTLPGV